MRHTWLTSAAAPLLAIAVLTMAACTSHVSENAADDPRHESGPTTARIVGLKGCVEAGGDSGEYMLRNVHLEPLLLQPTDTLTAGGVALANGSSVRLRTSDADELEKNVGQIVSVTGTMTGNGASTVGTGGAPRRPDHPEPLLSVEKVRGTGERCKEPGPTR
jgi:hypothetical protein